MFYNFAERCSVQFMVRTRIFNTMQCIHYLHVFTRPLSTTALPFELLIYDCSSNPLRLKLVCLVHQSLSGQSPAYLADDCRLVSDSTCRCLRSADVPTCVVPRTYSSCGDRTFAAAGPRLWNSLTVQLRNPDISYGRFRQQLKGHLFRNDEHGAL